MSLIDDARAAARKYGIPVDYFLRQINQESGFNPTAVSPGGAIGIAQFEPGTAAGLHIDPRNPVQSLYAAARLMASYVKQYRGNYAMALAAYNAGPGAVQYAISRGGQKGWMNYLPAETQAYIRIILGGKGSPPPNIPQSSPPSQSVATPTPTSHPAAIHPTPHTSPHTDPFGQPYTLSVPSQTPVRPQPLFQQPRAFSVPQQQTPAPTPKPKTIFGIPFSFSVPRQPAAPIKKPKATRPQPAPKLATAPVSKVQKKAQKAGKRIIGGPS